MGNAACNSIRGVAGHTHKRTHIHILCVRAGARGWRVWATGIKLNHQGLALTPTVQIACDSQQWVKVVELTRDGGLKNSVENSACSF